MAAFDRIRRPAFKPKGVPNSQENGVLKYDESGQVYREVVLRGGSASSDWKQRRKGDVKRFQDYRSSGPGCSSLWDMAIRSCLVNSDSLTTESLQYVPDEVGTKLWKSIREAELDTFILSMTFSAIYPRQLPCIHRHLYDLPYSLGWELQCLTSPPYLHLTCLSLSSVIQPLNYLTCLADCPALTVLALGPNMTRDEGSAIDDRLIRNWSLQAAAPSVSQSPISEEKKYGFKSLRVLIIRSPHQMTTAIFQYLYRFPSLMLLLLEDTPFSTNGKQQMKLGPQRLTMQQAGLHGWLQNPDRWNSYLAKHKVPDQISWKRAIVHLHAVAEDHAADLQTTSPPQTQTQMDTETETTCRSPSAPLMHLSIGANPPYGLLINREVACCWFRSRELSQSARSHAVADNKTITAMASGESKRTAEESVDRETKTRRKPPMVRASKQVDMTETISLFGK